MYFAEWLISTVISLNLRLFIRALAEDIINNLNYYLGVQKVTISNNNTPTESPTEIISLKDYILLNKKPYDWFEQISGPRSGQDGDSCSKVGCNPPIPSQEDCAALIKEADQIIEKLANKGPITPQEKKILDEYSVKMWHVRKDRFDLNAANLEYDWINDKHSNCQDGPPALRKNEPQLLAQLVAQGNKVKCLEESLIRHYAKLYYKVKTT